MTSVLRMNARMVGCVGGKLIRCIMLVVLVSVVCIYVCVCASVGYVEEKEVYYTTKMRSNYGRRVC